MDLRQKILLALDASCKRPNCDEKALHATERDMDKVGIASAKLMGVTGAIPLQFRNRYEGIFNFGTALLIGLEKSKSAQR